MGGFLQGPYEIGDKAMCLWSQGTNDNEYRECPNSDLRPYIFVLKFGNFRDSPTLLSCVIGAVEIVERKLGDNSNGNQYYVHYIECTYIMRLAFWDVWGAGCWPLVSSNCTPE